MLWWTLGYMCLFQFWFPQCVLTPGNINWQELIKRLHTYTETKYHPRANKFQSKTYHANLPATQEHSPELQYIGCPMSLQTHWHLITHYWTLHCTPERRNPPPPTRTLTQASLTRKPWQATHTTAPTVRKLYNKEKSTSCQNTERHPKHSNGNYKQAILPKNGWK